MTRNTLGGKKKQSYRRKKHTQENYATTLLLIVRCSTTPRKNLLVQHRIVLTTLVCLDRLTIVRNVVHSESSVKPATTVNVDSRQPRHTYPTLLYPEYELQIKVCDVSHTAQTRLTRHPQSTTTRPARACSFL